LIKLNKPKLYIKDEADLSGLADYDVWSTIGYLNGLCGSVPELINRAIELLNFPETLSNAVEDLANQKLEDKLVHSGTATENSDDSLLTEFVKIDDVAIKRTPLYQRISYKYAETEAILGEEFRLRNSIGYGDIEADFTFDGEEFEVEVGFDHMLFERLIDQDTEQTTQVNVGRSLTRDLEGYIGEPFVFYAPGRPAYTDGSSISFVEQGLSTHREVTQVWLATNCNAAVVSNVTKTINFGAEVDPFFLETFTSGLYSSFWQDYITDLYDTSRRLFTFSAVLPLRVMLDLKVNDKLTIHERDYLINSVSININTGETTLELLNNV